MGLFTGDGLESAWKEGWCEQRWISMNLGGTVLVWEKNVLQGIVNEERMCYI